MANTKEIQRRIKSVNNTKKITKAMEMVAASKMRKAIESVLTTRTYANLSWTTILNLSQAINGGKISHPLLKKTKNAKTVGIILMASNRGLCGGYNNAVGVKVHESILKHHFQDGKEEVKTEFITIGKKAEMIAHRYGYKISASFPKLDIVSEAREVGSIVRLVIDDFLDGKYEKIMVAYTDYINAVVQIPRVKQLLPVDVDAQDEYLGIMGVDSRVGIDKEYAKTKEKKYLKEKKDSYVFTYEPNAEEVLEAMLPRLIEIQLFQALLESNASEHSARMNAMHKATDAAGDLSKQLTLFYNKARQASITNEIAEIAAGVEAVK